MSHKDRECAAVVAFFGLLLLPRVVQAFSLGENAGEGFIGGETAAPGSLGVFALLGLGLAFGLKHATEVDHIVAVSTLVSEQRRLLRALLVGIFWGAGHTASVLLVGVMMLIVRVTIPEWVATWLEFAVGLMLIGLGASALLVTLMRRSDVHLHRHSHGRGSHVHVHFHEEEGQHHASNNTHSHSISRVGMKPLLVGAMHGLAGSAALVLLVLSQIDSSLLALLYLAVFGVGTIVGMLSMSGLIGLPFALASRRLSHIDFALHAAAGTLSVLFGLWYAYKTGIVNGLLKTLV